MLTVSNGDLNKLSAKTAELNDNDIAMYAWVTDGSGSYTGLAWLGSACVTGTGTFSKTSVTRGPSRYHAIIETAEVSCCRFLIRIIPWYFFFECEMIRFCQYHCIFTLYRHWLMRWVII